MIDALEAEARALARNPDIDVVVLTGADDVFAAGVDLRDEGLWQNSGLDVARHLSMSAGGRMSEAWRRMPQIVIAAVEGPAIGGGAILALCADFRVMAESSYLRFPEVQLGMTLGWGGLPLLAERIGSVQAKRILFDDPRINALEALSMGLCERVAATGESVSEATEWAHNLSKIPPLSLRMTKAALDAQIRRNWAEGGEADQFMLARLISESKS
jgi:enoyl-CoA hydratase/carnithine racemase